MSDKTSETEAQLTLEELKACKARLCELKLAEEALRASEEKYAKVFKYAPGLFVVSSTLEEGTLIEVNEAFEKIFKYKRQEVIGRSANELHLWVNPEDRAWVIQTLRELGEVRDHEIKFRDKTSKVFIGLYSGTTIEICGKVRLLSIIIDITERKRKEEEQVRLASIVKYSNDAIIIKSLDNIITAWNRGAERIFGYSADEVIGKPLTILAPPDRYEEMMLAIKNLELGENISPFETLRLTKDGRQIHVSLSISPIFDAGGKIIGASTIARDITEHKLDELRLQKNEERLRYSEDRLLSAIELTGIGTFDYYPLTGELIWSDMSKQHFGLPPDAHVDKNVFLAAVHPDDRKRVERSVENVLQLESCGEYNNEYKTIGIKDGKKRWLKSRGRAYFDDTGQPFRVLGTTLDITEQKQAEKEIEMLNAALSAHASELEVVNQELETFNYTVSHDLRKPLTIINGYCQAILEIYGNTLEEDCKKYLGEIYNGTLSMNELIDALLNFSVLSRREIHRETVDLSGMAETVAAGLRLTETEREVTFKIAEGITVKGDKALLRVVMENLLGNAWKYTGKQKETVIEFGVTEVAGKHAYFVRDNGPGFDMKDAKQLFVPFQRLPGADKFKGHGIGLATVARIIQRHGGRAWAKSEPGKGATFYFTMQD